MLLWGKFHWWIIFSFGDFEGGSGHFVHPNGYKKQKTDCEYDKRLARHIQIDQNVGLFLIIS